MAYVIVKGVVARTRAHFLGTVGHAIQFRPTPLNSLAVCPTNTCLEIQRVRCLTRHLVHRAMAFRYAPIAVDTGRKLYFCGKLRHPFLKFEFELTCNVIRNEYGGDEERC